MLKKEQRFGRKAHKQVKRGLLFGLVNLLIFTLVPNSAALDYIRISGVVQNSSPNPGSVFVRLWLQGQGGGNILADTEVKGSGSYTVLVPKNTPVEIALMSYSDGFTNFAGWKSSGNYTQDTVLNFTIPLGFKISGRIVDAQGRPLGNAFVKMNEFNDLMDARQISSDGTLWSGYRQSQMVKADSSGNFELFSYSTRDIGFKRTLVVEGSGTPGYRWSSPKFIVEGPRQFVVCIPINFGSTLSLPNYCSEDQVAYSSRIAQEEKAKQEAEAKAAAELKAKQEAEAKAAVEKVGCDANRAQLLSVQKSLLTAIKSYPSSAKTLNDTRLRLQAALSASCVADVTLNDFRAEVLSVVSQAKTSSATKRVTITCTKGKLLKKVTAANPKCPKGYKKK